MSQELSKPILYTDNPFKTTNFKSSYWTLLTEKEVHSAFTFHQSYQKYSATPLSIYDNLAEHLNLKNIYIKDEAYRYNLQSFKVLGGIYAIAKYISKLIGEDINNLSFERLISKEVKDKVGNITFVTATDGNHGRGVAWGARQLSQHAVVYMPKGSSNSRLNAIKETGAEGYITDLNYDEAVRMSAEKAEKNGWVVIQDTAWENYEEIPSWIVQGYSVLAVETEKEIQEQNLDSPTHVFLQAGVGSFAASIAGYYLNKYTHNPPKIIVVEPHEANCYYQSFLSASGDRKIVEGDLDTIMVGLACGEPNPIAWEILKEGTELTVSCPDWVAADGMRVLGNPLKDDSKIISGESGGLTMGLLFNMMYKSDLKDLKDRLELNKDSTVLLINTEGDTDPAHYLDIVWKGKYSE